MSKVILVKNNKGGVGKSWITLQLAHTLAISGYRTLIITSDSQNNILDFSGKTDEFPETCTLNYHLEQFAELETINLRVNLEYIPLVSATLDKKSAEVFPKFIDRAKQIYDAILIDASPVLGLDDCFVDVADKIVVPTYLDVVTTESIVSLLGATGGDKISIIIPNRFTRTKIEKEIHEELKNFFLSRKLLFTSPIKQSSFIGSLIDAGKTVWDVKSMKARELKEVFVKASKKLMEDE